VKTHNAFKSIACSEACALYIIRSHPGFLKKDKTVHRQIQEYL